MENDSDKEEVKYTILCVDDEKNILSSLRRLLRPDGYNVLLAGGGAEGLEILKEHHVDLIISDMRMPEMNGAEFLEQVYKEYPDTMRILLTGYSEISSTVDAINKGNIYKYISKPWEESDLKLTLRNALEQKSLEKERDRLIELTKKQNDELKEFNNNLEGLVKQRTDELEQTMDMLETAFATLNDSYSNTIKVFSGLVEMRDGALKSNSLEVADGVNYISDKLNLSDDDKKSISHASMLRDIGKISFPDSMIKRPMEDLDAISLSEIKKFTVIGEGILMPIEPLNDSAKIIRSFKEWFNGGGFPDGLKEDEIPLGSRILAVVNDYYALINGTLISGGFSASKAREFLIKNKNIRYDPKVVDMFLEFLGDVVEDDKRSVDKTVVTQQLSRGMKLKKDLVTKSGVVLLSRGYVLGEHMIKQITNLEKSLGEKFVISIE